MVVSGVAGNVDAMATTDSLISENISGNATDDGTPYWTVPWTIGLSASILVFMISAVIGNILVLLVVARHRGMRTRTNMFLCSLAITDLFTAILDMPVSFVTVFKGRWIFGSFTGPFCQFNGFTMVILFTASIHTMMYISVHKYVSITRPFSRILTHKRILLMIAAAWFWASLTAFVTLYGLNTVLYKPYTTQCGPDYPHDLVTYMHPVYMCLSCYFIPFGVMIFCYTRVFQEIRAHSIRLEKHTNQEKDVIFLQQRRITSTLLLVLVVFVLSWTPYIIYSIYASVLEDKSKVDKNVNALGYWFGYFSSAVNPIIYALRSPAFRDGYKEIMCQTKAIITSEETEPYESNSRLGRIRAFLRQSLRSTSSVSTTSQAGTPKPTMANLTNFLLRTDHRRTYSTNSLPEGFRYCSMDGPKLTVIGGIPVITIGGKIVYYKDVNERAKSKRNTFYGPDNYNSEPDPHGAIKEDSDEGLDNGDVKSNDEDYTDFLNRENNRIVYKRKSDELDSPSIMEKDPLLSPGEKTYTQRRSIISTYDDNVFVLIEDVEVPTVTLKPVGPPRIQITDEVGQTTDADGKPAGRVFNRSLSEHYPPEHSEDIDKLPRSASETSLKMKEHKGFLQKMLFNKFLMKAKKRESFSESSRSEDASDSSQSPKHYGRSVSEQPRKTSSASMDASIQVEGSLTVNDVVLKSHSDTMIDADKGARKHKGIYEKKKVDFDDSRKIHKRTRLTRMFKSRLEAKDYALRRAFSDKPRLQRAPSIEKLDKHKKGSKSQDIEVGTHARKSEATEYIQVKSTDHYLKVRSQYQKKRSHDMGRPNRTHLFRSISDPCMTFDMIEQRVMQRQQTRKFRAKSRKGTQNNHKSSQKQTVDSNDMNHDHRKRTSPQIFVFPECDIATNPVNAHPPKPQYPAVARSRHDTESSDWNSDLAQCDSIPSLCSSPEKQYTPTTAQTSPCAVIIESDSGCDSIEGGVIPGKSREWETPH